jgi:hypothetical protein
MINDLIQQIEKIKRNLYDQINALPQNENITVLSETPSIFVVKSNDVFGQPFSPEWHDYKAQYKMIVEELETSRIETFEAKLQSIITTGKIKSGNTIFTLNPAVVEFVRSIIS